MPENDHDKGGAVGIDLPDLRESKLLDIVYSADVSVESGATKDEIVEALNEADVRLTDEGWKKGEESFTLEERPGGSNGPNDITVLYCFRRANEHCDTVLDMMEEAFADTDYELREDSTETGKNTVSVVLPADAQEPEEPTEEEGADDNEQPTCAATTSDGEPCSNPVEEEGDFCHVHADEE